MLNRIDYIQIIIVTICLSIILLGCSTIVSTTERQVCEVSELADLFQIMVVNQAEGNVVFARDTEEQTSVGAYARYDNNTIYFTEPMLKMYREGKINRNQMMFVVGHELGHLNPKAKLSRGTQSEESFCDAYSLLILDELRNDGVKVDVLDAISYLKIAPGRGDVLHPHPAQRYADLMIIINDWKITKGWADVRG